MFATILTAVSTVVACLVGIAWPIMGNWNLLRDRLIILEAKHDNAVEQLLESRNDVQSMRHDLNDIKSCMVEIRTTLAYLNKDMTSERR